MRRHAVAVSRAAALMGLAVIGWFQALLLLLVMGFGYGVSPAFPPTVMLVRRGAARARRRALRWSGVRIEDPYLPPPPPPVPQADGLYRRDRSLYASPRVPARQDRLKWLFTDPATWRDLVWRLLDPFVVLVLCGLPLLVTGYALVVPWRWSPLFAPLGVAVAVGAVAVLPWLVRAHGSWSRMLLAPTPRSVLARRLRHLAATRSDAIDSQAAELRRIERELHDGAQARLVAVGMTLGAARELVASDPAAARALLAQARDASADALAELRRVVRGIHPPVLAERGLGDAVRALALDSPLKVTVEVDLPVRPGLPVESAAYFAVGEVLAALAREGDGDTAHVDVSHQGPRLRLTVEHDGGVTAEWGEIERRLAAFDGVLAVTGPPGGPLMVIMELPYALAGSVADDEARMPLWKTCLVALAYAIAWLPLFPQGLVTAFMKIFYPANTSWFLALHLPDPYQWPTILLMIMLGLFLYGMALVLPITHSPERWAMETTVLRGPGGC